MRPHVAWMWRLAGVQILAAALPCSTLLAQDRSRDELLQLSEELFEAMLVHRDSDLFAAVALDDILVVPPGGIVENREQVIAGLTNFRITSVSVDDVQIALHGSTAVVVGRLTPVGELRGSGPLPRIRFMNVFVDADGTWRLLARSLTPCAERAVAAGRC